jgi:hypothetical protein
MRVTGPAQPEKLLLDVVNLLAEQSIPYALIGALAASFYGIPRAATDADAAIWLKDTAKTLEDLTNCLLAAGYRAEYKRGDLEDPPRIF